MSPAELVVVNPATGELLEQLDQQPADTLTDALAAIRTRQDDAARMAAALEGELRRRLAMRGRKMAVFGNWEVDTRPSRERDWDVNELEGAIGRLIEDGTIKAGEVADVITRPPVVSKSKALALAKRLDGTAREQINAAWTWKDKPGKLTLTRSVELIAPAAEQTSQDEMRHTALTPEDGSPAGSAQPPAAPAPQTPPAPPAFDFADLFK